MSPEKSCLVPNCDSPRHYIHPHCRKHHRRLKLYGDPLAVAPKRPLRLPKLCTVDGCTSAFEAKGMCQRHYRQLVNPPKPKVGPGRRQRGVCSMVGCTRPHYGNSLCQMHWNRMDRHGDAGPADYIRPPYAPTCKVDGCNEKHCSKGYCNTHYRRQLKRGTTDPIERTYPLGTEHHNWVKVPSYPLMHRRIDRKRGVAATHRCVRCGERALQWSYDHMDPNELTSLDGLSAGCVYSLNIDRYQAMCRSCHAADDSAHRRETGVKYGDRKRSVSPSATA